MLKWDDPLDYVDEVRCTIKYQMKKVLELNVVTVDSANMSEDDLSRNIQLSINFSISLLKSGWKNIKVRIVHEEYHGQRRTQNPKEEEV